MPRADETEERKTINAMLFLKSFGGEISLELGDAAGTSEYTLGHLPW